MGGGGVGTPVGIPVGGGGAGAERGERRQEKPSSAISTLGTVQNADLMPFRSFLGHSAKESKPRNAINDPLAHTLSETTTKPTTNRNIYDTK